MPTSAGSRHRAIISGFGMVASLGYDVSTVCAAARAGLVRPHTLEHFRIRSAVEGDEQPVVGHQATLLTRGFETSARQIRLAQGALTDLLRRTPHIDWQKHQHQFYVVLPDPGRIDSGEALLADSSAKHARLERIAERNEQEASAETRRDTIAERMLERAAALAYWPTQASLAAANFGDRVSALHAIQAAISDLESGAIELAVILAVDSLLDEGTLNWLHACGRLKCDAAPAGLQPGEAGVAIVLSSRASSYAQAVEIQHIALARDGRSFLSGNAAAGEALAEVVGQVWSASEQSKPWIMADQNGEHYRAMDWGFAVVRLRAKHAAFAAPAIWYTAASVGDTGVAAPLVGACFAATAWERGYAPADLALITACADDGERGALALTRMSGSP